MLPIPNIRKFRPTFGKYAACLLCLLLALGTVVCAQGQTEQEESPGNENIRSILVLLASQMETTRKELNELSTLPTSKRVQEQKEELLIRMDGIQQNFESIATQLQTQDWLGDPDKETDWVKQVQSLTMPVLDAVSELTEKPRKIERLKKRVAALEEQLQQFEAAHRNITSLMGLPSPENIDEEDFAQYKKRLDYLEQKFDPKLIRLKLEEARRALKQETETSEPLMDTATNAVQNFFKHRGLNLLITVSLFATLWWVLMKLRAFLVGKRSLFNLPSWMNKVLMTVYSILVLLICIISSMVSLYLLNDWLLLSIVILFLIAVAWASRQLIPRMFKEVRLAMNLGTVKEHERLVWSGVPWLVENIGLQATLVNESLEGGSIMLPVGDLVGKHSRPVVDDEPWFPTEVGDWVFLSDKVYGQVAHQTLEQMILRLKGGAQKFYPTEDFLALAPMNISRGFRYEIDFALDYGTQPRICDDIPKLFFTGLRAHMAPYFEDPDPDFPHLEISFDHADRNALHLRVILDVHGRRAENYHEIEREIQTTLVRICNENDLRIPYTQVTLSLNPDLQNWAEGRSGNPSGKDRDQV